MSYLLEKPRFDDPTGDGRFFLLHVDRRAHIRVPTSDGEFKTEFTSLGPHETGRRRVLVWRLHRMPGVTLSGALMRIPFLAFADETIEGRDDVLLPIIEEIMEAERGA